jgi:hypothetical protein
MKLYIRDGVTSIEQLKPYKFHAKDDKIRYCFHQMVGIINTKLGFNQRGCEKELKNLGLLIEIDANRTNKLEYCDFWHYQLDAIFRNEVRNDQCNSIYVGTPEGINLKKLKRELNDWQLFLLNEWNKMFSHLADKHGWIKVEVWW